MTNIKKTIASKFTAFTGSLRSARLSHQAANLELPIRAELFSASQMEQHGRVLAKAHQLGEKLNQDQLLSRLDENEKIIGDTCNLLRTALKAGSAITPAAEWLLDNLYLIEEQIRTARRHLPKGYSSQLPRLKKGLSAGYPRVYDIALEVIAHGDGRINSEGLERFVTAYQQVTALKLGELWAIPIMLRLALIENLRRVSTRVAINTRYRSLAGSWADKMTKTAETNPGDLILTVADMARSEPPEAASFVAELVRRLQGLGPTLTLPLTWLTQHMAGSGLTIEELINIENQQQAAKQVSISNSIGSLRFLATMDWREFVETMSVVNQMLRNDSARIYDQMDFSTRDQYRHVVERLARYSALTEIDIAARAVELSEQGAAEHGIEDHRAHVGYYLIDDGLPQLEQAVKPRVRVLEAIYRIGRRAPLFYYASSIFLLTLFFTGGLLSQGQGLQPWLIAVVGLISLVATSQLAIALVNWVVTLSTRPRALPRMNYANGIPLQARTLVVVPTIVFDADNIDALCEALEVRFLANRDANLRFCLLTDFADAHTQTTEGDAALLAQLQDNIQQLNAKYAEDNAGNDFGRGDRFLLLHRPRLWNEQEQIWMGHERKRGKLNDLNAFLRGTRGNPFSCIAGSTEGLSSVKYVITLDTDTQLARDSARQFVASLAHPLNRAYYDEEKQRVTHGYGILQPRVATCLPRSNASRYELMFGGEPGIDPYTRTVSDVYQDLFSEGSFIGKGIYDIHVFERVLSKRFPDNRILSHDLLEGCYIRSGLLSDASLHEVYPSSYEADVSRRHRWIRGDWQLLPWLLPRVPPADGNAAKPRPINPLSALSRLKLLDNLRRSLASSALVLLLLLEWFLLPASWLWTCAALGIIFAPPLLSVLPDLFHKPAEVMLRQHLWGTWRLLRQRLEQALLTLAFLPYETFFSLDAIVRTLWRMLITHKHLLEWNPSSVTGGAAQIGVSASYRRMWSSPFMALAVATALSVSRIDVLFAVMPILLLWFGAPLIAWWISLPLERKLARLSEDQTFFLHRLARKTWAFFEVYVGPDNNWLPPDNMQEEPVAALARRTSPTNIGLALLANLTAYDFGYLSTGQLLERSHNTLNTMQALERYNGHFYNWYATQDLKPLQPMYISTVDSGNLAGHLLTLAPGLLSLPDLPIVSPRIFQGISDTYNVLSELAGGATQGDLLQIHLYLNSILHAVPTTMSTIAKHLKQLSHHTDKLAASFAPSGEIQVNWWAQALARQCRDACDEIDMLAPWSLAVTSTASDSHLLSLAGAAAPTLRALAELESRLDQAGALAQATVLSRQIVQASRAAAQRIDHIERLATQAVKFAQADYDFLYDKATHLLSVGYNLTERRCDTSYYDLLASEARLCSFVVIAQGRLPQENWFALGRQLTLAGGEPALLSWSGSMFEYLMPLLVMPSYENTLLDQTYKAAVQRQIEYGEQRGVPWGISESAFNTFDTSLNYQYRAFGVPGLGLKRGLGDDLVVAPYASMLALMVAPEAACANLQRLAAEGFEGQFGLYEAIDYTPARLSRGKSHALIKSFMAHHQGMGLLSLAYLLLDQPMQKRFESDPLFQATLLLLQERIPKTASFYTNTSELADIRTIGISQNMPTRILNRANTRRPEIQLLSNGQYHVMVTNSGGSSSRWRGLDVTRWREDPTRDHWGIFCYVRDLDSGLFWSTAYQPTLKQAENYEVIFSEDRAEFRRYDHGLDMHTEIVVSPEDDIQLRRTRIVNRSRVRKTIDVTSYCEVVLAPAPADATHPAFSNLFVQTEILAPQHSILCTRRPRSQDEKVPWMFSLMIAHGGSVGSASFETDRRQFIGRGNTLAAPLALIGRDPLSGSQGAVLDPIIAIRYQISLDPEQHVTLDSVTGVAETRDTALHLIDKYQDRYLADRVFDLAWTHNHVVLRQLNASDADAQLYGRMAGYIIYASAFLRADPSILINNQRTQSGLWGHGISGDWPIVLLKIKSADHIDMVRQMVQAHAYWRLKGLTVDLVIWNEDHASYRQLLQDQILGLIGSSIESQNIDRPGGIYVRMAEQMAHEDRVLLQSVSRLILTDDHGTLSEQVNRRTQSEARPPQLIPAPKPRAAAMAVVAALPPATSGADRNLILFNGLGGFTQDGREYIIINSHGSTTPAPWANVLANPLFGSIVSESGQAYTWGENAHEFRLTPWHNDPVCDSAGEAFYLRDEHSGKFWSPTALPRRGQGEYISRHGFGYSVFEHDENGIYSELSTYVANDASIKYSVLKVRNNTDETRTLSATGYVQWVLAELPAKSAMHIVTEADLVTGTLSARNAYNADGADLIAFFATDASIYTTTCDRTEFIGRNESLQDPAAMSRIRLSGKYGAGLDPCAAIQVPFELLAGQEREIVFILGVTRHPDADVDALVRRYQGSENAQRELAAVHAHWQHMLMAVQIETPDPAINVLVNGWLMYQTIASRVWGRSGYYQSGGAYGFRDQLQDTMALVHTRPDLMREHLLRCAAHQFVEGDVQHWWHPPSDRGVRTHCSDDYLWLPLATCRYVASTGDTGVLDEIVPFIEGRPVGPGEDSYYDMPTRSAESATVYQHCVRAISHGLRFGQHGLPLMGSGDWNDGMDKVGAQGKGESVWLGFFLYDVLMQFTDLAKQQNDDAFARKCQQEAAALQANLEKNGWDGLWYRRAYFDDGTPLGSASNTECQIDSISQSWAVLSGAGDAARCSTAMQAVNERLVRRGPGLIQLLDPPFDKSPVSPGYIRGYVPGVRENGGQYTHAAIWTTMAFAKLGLNRTAWELLELINPVNHGKTAEEIAVYKVEPYVMAADVYAVAPHTGRGGWTWYTGSSSWMYRLIVESLLGLQRKNDSLVFSPCLPDQWSSFTLQYRYKDTLYKILVVQEYNEAGQADSTVGAVANPAHDMLKSGQADATHRDASPAATRQISVWVDGAEQADGIIHLIDDKTEHTVRIIVRGSR